MGLGIIQVGRTKRKGISVCADICDQTCDIAEGGLDEETAAQGAVWRMTSSSREGGPGSGFTRESCVLGLLKVEGFTAVLEWRSSKIDLPSRKIILKCNVESIRIPARR